MKISLIAPPLMDYTNGVLQPISMDQVRTCPPYGIYYLGTILRGLGHTVAIIDLVAQGSLDLSHYWSILTDSSLIGIGCSSLSWPTARTLITNIRQFLPSTPIVLGGIHPTMFDHYLLNTSGATFVIRGEGERALPQLCEFLTGQRNIRTVANLTYRNVTGRLERTEVVTKLTPEELTRFPVPDYRGIPNARYTGLAIESSRGCPFDCAFCSTSYRRSWRAIPASNFVDRLEQILPYTQLTTHGLVQIIDDEFTVKTDRVINIFNILNERQLKPKLVFDARATDLIKPHLVESMAPYLQQMLIGAECGYNEGLERVGKGVTTQQLEQAASLLREHNLAARADYSFVIGFPWETKEEVLKTVEFAFMLNAKYGARVLLQWYCQIPGSRLWDEQRKKQTIHEAQYDEYGFFRNHYLFRTGVMLLPRDIIEIHSKISQMSAISGMSPSGLPMIMSSVPEAILRNYPPTHEESEHAGLTSLREVAGVV